MIKNNNFEINFPNGTNLGIWNFNNKDEKQYIYVNDGEHNSCYVVGYVTDSDKINDILIKGHKFIDEICPYCDKLISLPDNKGIYECPCCGNLVINCFNCENKDCKNCKFIKITGIKPKIMNYNLEIVKNEVEK